MMERKVTLRFQIPSAEQTKGASIVLSVAANSMGFNRGRSAEVLLGLRYGACAFNSSSVTNSSAEACVASDAQGAARL